MGLGSGCLDPGTEERRLNHLLPRRAHSLTQRAFLLGNLSSDANGMNTLTVAHLRIGHMEGNPEVGNSEYMGHQDCPPQLVCFLWHNTGHG